MKLKIKWLVTFESVLILLLLALLLSYFFKYSQLKNIGENSGLLSPRVYAGLLEPKSFLIVNFSPLQEKIQSHIGSKNVSVYLRNLRNGASMGINEKMGYFPASLIKIPLAILVMEKVENGELGMDAVLPVTASDKSNTSGVLYKTDKKELPVHTLIEKLLKDSDNTAYDVLFNQVKEKEMVLLFDYFDVNIPPIPSQTSPNANTILVSPKTMSNIFSSLFFSTLLNPMDSEYLLGLMTETAFDIKKIAGIPEGIIISQKYGVYYYDNRKYFHSCGILYIQKSRIFYCVMTKDMGEGEAVQTIAYVLNQTQHYVIEEKAELDAFKAKGIFD